MLITTCCWYFLFNRWITWDTFWSWLIWSRSWWSLARTVGSCSSAARLTRRPSMTSCWPSRASPFLMTQNLSITTPNCSRCVTCLWVIHCSLQTFMNKIQCLNIMGILGDEWWIFQIVLSLCTGDNLIHYMKFYMKPKFPENWFFLPGRIICRAIQGNVVRV